MFPSTLLGEVEGATLVTLHRFSGKLPYPTFDDEAHPAPLCSLKLSLRTLHPECYDYPTSANPPILHRKEAFVPDDDPGYAKLEKLTRQKEKAGLVDDAAGIGNEVSGSPTRGPQAVSCAWVNPAVSERKWCRRRNVPSCANVHPLATNSRNHPPCIDDLSSLALV